MSELVNCGCGGEAKVCSYLSREDCAMVYFVRCEKCGIETEDLPSEAEAVEAWNKAMSADKIEFLSEYATGLQTEPERTAEVLPTKNGRLFKCSNCGQYMRKTYWSSPVKYCSGCGARLEWE